MKIGVYPNMPNKDYHTSKGVSNSGIGKILNSPKFYKHHSKNNWKGEGLRVGSPFHTLLLEPHKFDDEFIIVDEIPYRHVYESIINGDDFVDCDLEHRRGNLWKLVKEANQGKAIYLEKEVQAAKAFIELSGDKLTISVKDYEKALRLVETTKANKSAMAIVDHPDAVFEQSIFFNDFDTGLLCKIRPDITLHDKFYDLKSTSDAGIGKFKQSIKKFNYHRQAAYYLHGAACSMMDVGHFGFIATDDEDVPTCTVFHRLGDVALEAGEQDFRRGLELFAACEESGNWHGKQESYDEISPYFYLDGGV